MQPYLITTVLTPATNFNLTSVENLRSDLALSDTSITDDYLDRLIQQSARAIVKHCDLEFAVQTYRDAWKNSSCPLTSSNVLLAANLPLVEVTLVSEDGATLASGTSYESNKDSGALYRLNGSGSPQSWSRSNLVIEYRAGWLLPGEEADEDDESPPTALPPDVEDACIRLVKARLLARGRDSNVRMENVEGVGSKQYWVPTGADSGNIPPDIADILAPYCRVSVI
jgi:hypothetical protein